MILALLTLLLGGFGLYHDLGVPLALGVAVMLLAGLTLLPALLAVTAGLCSTAPVTRRWCCPVPAAAAGGHDAGAGLWGRVAARAVRRPAAVLGIGVLIFAALAAAATGYKTASIDRSATAPAGSDAAAGNALLASDFPQSSASPSDLILRYAQPVWQHPQSAATAARRCVTVRACSPASPGRSTRTAPRWPPPTTPRCTPRSATRAGCRWPSRPPRPRGYPLTPTTPTAPPPSTSRPMAGRSGSRPGCGPGRSSPRRR